MSEIHSGTGSYEPTKAVYWYDSLDLGYITSGDLKSLSTGELHSLAKEVIDDRNKLQILVQAKVDADESWKRRAKVKCRIWTAFIVQIHGTIHARKKHSREEWFKTFVKVAHDVLPGHFIDAIRAQVDEVLGEDEAPTLS